MRRRTFLQAASSAAIGWPMRVAAEKDVKRPLVALLYPSTEDRAVKLVAALRDGLKQAGAVEGTHYALAVCIANGDMAQLPKLAKELDALGPKGLCGRCQRCPCSSPATTKHAFGLYRDCS